MPFSFRVRLGLSFLILVCRSLVAFADKLGAPSGYLYDVCSDDVARDIDDGRGAFGAQLPYAPTSIPVSKACGRACTPRNLPCL